MSETTDVIAEMREGARMLRAEGIAPHLSRISNALEGWAERLDDYEVGGASCVGSTIVDMRGGHEHNCIPCSKWFRSGWTCVRCTEWFKVDMTGWHTRQPRKRRA